MYIPFTSNHLWSIMSHPQGDHRSQISEWSPNDLRMISEWSPISRRSSAWTPCATRSSACLRPRRPKQRRPWSWAAVCRSCDSVRSTLPDVGCPGLWMGPWGLGNGTTDTSDIHEIIIRWYIMIGLSWYKDVQSIGSTWLIQMWVLGLFGSVEFLPGKRIGEEPLDSGQGIPGRAPSLAKAKVDVAGSHESWRVIVMFVPHVVNPTQKTLGFDSSRQKGNCFANQTKQFYFLPCICSGKKSLISRANTLQRCQESEILYSNP